MKTLILVDFDGTLTRKDSTVRLLLSLVRHHPRRIPALLPDLRRMLAARGRGDADGLQAAKCRAVGTLIQGLTDGELEAALYTYTLRVARLFRPTLLLHLKNEQWAGKRVFIVTASPDLAVQYALSRYGLEVIGTRFEKRKGRYTGTLATPPCFGPEKLTRVEARLREEGLAWPEDTEGWADSPSDQPLLDRCTRQMWVGRNFTMEAAPTT